MNPYDLERVRMNLADACLVLANKRELDPDTEDAANIMRIISVKNYSSKVRVCIQLLQYHNKAYLLNIPSWNSCSGGDEVICLSELKMGFLAQSCLAPGFSTLLANLFSMRSSRLEEDNNEIEDPNFISANSYDLQTDYLRGISQEVYIEYFSPAFIGLTFTEAASLCLEKLHVLLIAIDTNVSGAGNLRMKSSSGDDTSRQQCSPQSQPLEINPGSNVFIKSWTQGFFICDSHEEARRVLLFCNDCHADLENPDKMRKCRCNPDKLSKNVKANVRKTSIKNGGRTDLVMKNRFSPTPLITIVGTDSSSIFGNSDTIGKEKDTSSGQCHSPINDNSVMRFDLTGMFHWCPEAEFDKSLVTKRNWDKFHGFKNHVVVCIFAEKDSPLIGLRNLVMPLRASNMHREELKPIVFVGNVDFLRREWKGICNFPQLTLVGGSPMNRATLRMVRINNATMCILMSAKFNFMNRDDPYLIDKEVILCSLNIKAMRFEGEINEILPNQHTPLPGRRTVSSVNSSISRVDDDTGLVIANESLLSQEQHQLSSSAQLKRTVSVKNTPCKSVHLISELVVDGNVQFLDQDDEDSPDSEVYLTQPYACGAAFTTSVLDSLLSFAYFNPNAMTLIRNLTTGGATPELEQILAEGIGLQGCFSTLSVFKNRDRCRIAHLSVCDYRFQEVMKSGNDCKPPTFQQMFTHALQNYRILCIGVYRLRDPWKGNETEKEVKAMRFVITKPRNNYPLLKSDLLFCLVPFDSCYNAEDDLLTRKL